MQTYRKIFLLYRKQFIEFIGLHACNFYKQRTITCQFLLLIKPRGTNIYLKLLKIYFTKYSDASNTINVYYIAYSTQFTNLFPVLLLVTYSFLPLLYCSGLLASHLTSLYSRRRGGGGRRVQPTVWLAQSLASGNYLPQNWLLSVPLLAYQAYLTVPRFPLTG